MINKIDKIIMHKGTVMYFFGSLQGKSTREEGSSRQKLYDLNTLPLNAAFWDCQPHAIFLFIYFLKSRRILGILMAQCSIIPLGD